MQYGAIYTGLLLPAWFNVYSGRVTHICVRKLTIIGSDKGLSPHRRPAIIWTIAELSIIGPLGTNFGEILIEILTFSLKKNAFESVVCETATILSRPQCVNYAGAFIWDVIIHPCPNFNENTINVRHGWIIAFHQDNTTHILNRDTCKIPKFKPQLQLL